MRTYLVLLAAVLSCSKARPREGEPAQPVSWNDEIGPLFEASCNSCHSGAQPGGGYRTTSYLEALGPTSQPVAIAGDASSLILAKIDPAKANANHANVGATFAEVKAWVVDGRLALNRGGTHEGGILNPNDPAFHKNLVHANGWNFSQCQQCHGADLTGGKAGVSCQECHAFEVGANGASSCTTCHGNGGTQSPAPPRSLTGATVTSDRGVGAHQTHLFGRFSISARIACSACHAVPSQIDDKGHIDHLRPAIVAFSGLALADGAQPVWNGASCSATYCHGGGAKLSTDTSAKVQQPVWTADLQVFCGSCHGAPPANAVHKGIKYPDCSRCHANTVTPGGSIILSGPPDAPTSFHLNGVIDVTP